MSAALALVRREEAYVDGKVLCVHDLEHAKSFEHAVVEFFMQLFDSVLYRKQSAIRFLSRSATGRGGGSGQACNGQDARARQHFGRTRKQERVTMVTRKIHDASLSDKETSYLVLHVCNGFVGVESPFCHFHAQVKTNFFLPLDLGQPRVEGGFDFWGLIVVFVGVLAAR